MKKLIGFLILMAFCVVVLLSLKGMRSKTKAKAATPAQVSAVR